MKPCSLYHGKRLLLVWASCAVFAGCLFKPTTVATRHFLLAPLPQSATNAPVGDNPAVGVGLVKIPDYLSRTSLAVRLGTNEIQYLETVLWAEPLEQSFQRAVAANLARMLPTDRLRLSAWQSGDV